VKEKVQYKSITGQLFRGKRSNLVANHLANLFRADCYASTFANAHHIFPKNFLKKGLKQLCRGGSSSAELLFLASRLKTIKLETAPPSEYFSEFKGADGNNPNFNAAVRSHLIPCGADSPIWDDKLPNWNSTMQQAKDFSRRRLNK
jgi:hypothetical protein